MRSVAGGLVCAVLLVVLPRASGLAQETDYLIVPGQRVGRWLLGVPFDVRALGSRQAWRWEGKGRDIPYYDVAYFPLTPAAGLELRTCRDGGTSLSILAMRQLDRPVAPGDMLQYATAQGIRIGSDERLVQQLGRPRVAQAWKERHGQLTVSVTSFSYPGLEIRVNRADRRVFAVGATRASAWDLCYQGAFGGRAATRRPELTVTGPQGVPLPRALRVVPPGPAVPSAHAAFAGKWLGTWAGPKASGAHVLVVEEITPTADGHSRVVAVWAYNSPGAGRVWERITGTLDGDLRFTFEGGSYTYKMLADGVLETIWRASPGEEIYAVMRRIKD